MAKGILERVITGLKDEELRDGVRERSRAWLSPEDSTPPRNRASARAQRRGWPSVRLHRRRDDQYYPAIYEGKKAEDPAAAGS
jgi:hypothetical protein